MKIWRLLADANRYACFADHPTLSLEEILSIDGRSLAHDWETRKLERIDDSDLPLGDALGFGANFLVNDAVRQLFTDLGISGIEYLPMEYQGITYYLPNVTEKIDCLDRQRSAALYSPTNKDRILFVNKYCFHEHLIGEKIMFRLKDEPRRMAFVTETVVSALREAGMKGFCYELVYDGKEDPGRKVSVDGVISLEY